MATALRAYNRAGRRLKTIPWSTLSRTVVRNQPGALTTTVPRSMLDDVVLGDEVYLRLVEDGVESPDYYLIDDDGDDESDEGGAGRAVAVGAQGVVNLLDWAEVYPWDHVPGQPLLGLNPQYPFGDSTPGRIMLELLQRAQARGVIPHVRTSFTWTHDSAGQPWPSVYSRVYDLGDTLLKVLTTMVEDAWVDYEMTGFTLNLYVPDTAMAVDHPKVVLHLGKEVTSAPRKRTRRNLRSVLLANGAEGALIEIEDADAVARIGRREGYEGRGGITDVGTLTAATEVSMGRRTKASESFTLGVVPGSGLTLPRPGAYVRYDQRRLNPRELEPMRVQSLAWEYGEAPTLSVELADMWVDRDVQLERRVSTILNGSSANERVPLPPLGDEVPPSEPQGLSATSAPFSDNSGQTFAQVTASWMQVTTDVDGTPVGELLGYQLEWRQPTVNPGSYVIETGVVTLQHWSPVVPGERVQLRIRAFDRWRNMSTWSPWVEIEAGVDVTPPPTPSTPLVDNYLGLLRIRWDGLTSGGLTMPADLDVVEVHVSPSEGFEPDETTLVGATPFPSSVFHRVPYEQEHHVRFVARDRTGNRSPASAAATGETSPIVGADVLAGAIEAGKLADGAVTNEKLGLGAVTGLKIADFAVGSQQIADAAISSAKIDDLAVGRAKIADAAIGSAKIADAAIVRAKIDDLAVNTAKVGELSVGRLSAGTMTAEVTVSGRLATSLNTSVQRTEMNALGFYGWNGTSSTPTLQLDGINNILTGLLQTAQSGRRVVMGGAGVTGQLSFMAPDGRFGRLMSLTEGTGLEATRLEMSTGSYVNLNTENYTSYRARIHEFVLGSGLSGTTQAPAFRVYTDAFLRLTIDQQKFLHTTPNSEQEYRVNGTTSWRFGSGGGEVTWAPGGGFISPLQTFYTGQGHGILIRGYADSSRQELEVTNAAQTGYYSVRAGGFNVGSDEVTKRSIRSVSTQDMLDDVLGTKVRRYRRKHRGDKPEEIGLIAQEAPARIVAGTSDDLGLAVDLYQMGALTWGAVQRLHELLQETRGELAALRTKVAA